MPVVRRTTGSFEIEFAKAPPPADVVGRGILDRAATDIPPLCESGRTIAHCLWQNHRGRRNGIIHGRAQEGRWQNDPIRQGRMGDLMYCQGLNRLRVFHRYAMQPWTKSGGRA